MSAIYLFHTFTRYTALQIKESRNTALQFILIKIQADLLQVYAKRQFNWIWYIHNLSFSQSTGQDRAKLTIKRFVAFI